MSFFGWVIGKSIAKYYGRVISTINGAQGMTVSTVSNATTITFTADQLLGGMINYDPLGGSATATTATAALIVAALGDAAVVGATFDLEFIHGGSTSEVVTLAGGTDVTLSPTTMAFDGDEILSCKLRIDNITEDSEACTLYSLGLSLLTT